MKMLVTSILESREFGHNILFSSDRNDYLNYIYFVICKCIQWV